MTPTPTNNNIDNSTLNKGGRVMCITMRLLTSALLGSKIGVSRRNNNISSGVAPKTLKLYNHQASATALLCYRLDSEFHGNSGGAGI